MTERAKVESMEVYRSLCKKLDIEPLDEDLGNHYHWVVTGSYKLMTFDEYGKRR